MKKNRMMRLASILLVCVLLSTSVISGTFAKYVTKVESEDKARVAKWGFNTASISIENLFNLENPENVVGQDSDGTLVIAPGTSGSASFKFENTLTAGPEVKYTFKVDTTGSACDENIQANKNITWALVETAKKSEAKYGTWETLIADIKALSGAANGEKEYDVGAIPAMVDKDYTILWKWTFTNGDDGNEVATNDSYLGNLAVEKDLVATLKITITATQVD